MSQIEGVEHPIISLELLRELDETYPEKCPEITWQDRKVWEEVGKRKVVRHLISIYNVQHPEAPYTGKNKHV